MEAKKSINLMVIGVGLHAQKVYLPALKKLQAHYDVSIKVGIDLVASEKSIHEYLQKNNMFFPLRFIHSFKSKQQLPNELANELTAYVKIYDINAVIISTEPLVHKAYAEWALKNELHILMDKPVTTRENVVSEWQQAVGLYTDYLRLNMLYEKLQQKKSTIFSVNVQRRYHPIHRKVLSLINEVAHQFNAPVTSIQSCHADGQWRLPTEIINQSYHPYCQGYGKGSHSGYHLFDIFYQYYLAGKRDAKFADTLQVFSSFIQPGGFIKQFNREDYRSYFGDEYLKSCQLDDDKLISIMNNYGEMDAFIILKFLKDNQPIANGSINLLHNSFARRTWMQPGKDLYKGNGRVKHESHIIQQGPFQCLQIHSYQSNDKHDHNDENDFLPGGNNHMDLYVYRNTGMYADQQPPFAVYNLKNIDHTGCYSGDRLVHEQAKEAVLIEFLDFIEGKIEKQNLLSNFPSHAVPVKIMSSVYQSHIQQMEYRHPIIEFEV
jgi:hypothetical protein